ncbi:MAG: PTS sugar transporter subunit IIA [Kiritimatiellae bacterium]|nr:PTS sugar transporter subunit IIA [Kiritimatiellia bacterium]
MNALLKALEEGRLIELPVADKKDALTLLASLIEAVPGVRPNAQVVEGIMAREAQSNTYLGHGIACPHARTADEGEMLCAVGWSPKGIAYGNPDGTPVRLVLLYYIPANHRNAYLKEISLLARALETGRATELSTATTLADVRIRMLDLVSSALDSAAVTARARMIRLETKQAAAAAAPPDAVLASLNIQPLLVILAPATRPIVLAQHRELVDLIESSPPVGETLSRQGSVDVGEWRIVSRGTTPYAGERVVIDCIAVKKNERPIATSARTG